MAHTFGTKIKNFLGKPQIILPIALVIALCIGAYFYFSANTSKNYATTAVAEGTVTSNLTTDGTVKAATETTLAFPEGGRVSSIGAYVGEHVAAGTTLASLDSTAAEGAVEEAQGALQTAQANYNLLINGASASDISIAQTNYNTTVSEEALAVKTAQQKLFSDGLVATTSQQSTGVAAPLITGTYTGTTQGSISIQVYATGNGGYWSASGLVTANGNVSAETQQPLGDSGLFIVFPSANTASYGSTSWTVTIPNTSGPNYTADNTAYAAAVQDQTDKVAIAKAALDKINSAPRTEDVAAAQAQISSAQGALQTAQGALANDFITAPFGGVINSVSSDVTAGSIVSADTPIVGIMSAGAFQIESYVSEKDLALVTVGEPVSITTDAYGPSVVFAGKVIEVDPAATPEPNGDLGYKVTYQFSGSDQRIKPGLSAHVLLSGDTKTNVLQIPSTAIYLKNGSSFVLIKNGKDTEEVPVTVGLVGAGNTEITSGLTAGEEVVTLGNN